MLLINPTITPLRESAKEFFDELCNVGICHYSVESLSYSIQSISDIERWWSDEKTISARKFFANNFAYRSDDPIKYLSDVIKSFN
jgi:putative transferase (TIGR04331 family)